MRPSTLCAIIAIFVTSNVVADAPATLVKHDYDVRRLISYIPDFTDAPDFGLIATGAVSTTRPSPKIPSRDEIVAGVIKSVRGLLPGGAAGNVVEEKGILHVTATPADQARIASAIDRWIAARGVEITVETRLLSLNHMDVAGLDPTVRALLDDVSMPGHTETIDDNQVNALLHATEAAKDTVLVTAPRITLFQNQRAYVLIANQQAYISGYALDTSPQGKGDYKPVTRVVEDGIVLDVRASAASSGNASAISLDFREQLAKLHGMNASTWLDPQTHEKRPIQIPDVSIQSIDRLLTALPGNTILLRLAHPTTIGNASENVSQVNPGLEKPAPQANTGGGIPFLDRLYGPAEKPGQEYFLLIKATIVKPAVAKQTAHEPGNQ